MHVAAPAALRMYHLKVSADLGCLRSVGTPLAHLLLERQAYRPRRALDDCEDMAPSPVSRTQV